MPQIPDSPVILAGTLLSVEPIEGRDNNNQPNGVIVARRVLVMEGGAALQVKVPEDRYELIPDHRLVIGTFVLWSVTGRPWKMDNGNHGVTYTYQGQVDEAALLGLVTRLELRDSTAPELAKA